MSSFNKDLTIKENEQLKKENQILKNTSNNLNIEIYKKFLNDYIDHNKKLRSQNDELRTIIKNIKLQYDKLQYDKDIFLQLFIDEIDQRENIFKNQYEYNIDPFEYYINSLNINEMTNII